MFKTFEIKNLEMRCTFKWDIYRFIKTIKYKRVRFLGFSRHLTLVLLKIKLAFKQVTRHPRIDRTVPESSN